MELGKPSAGAERVLTEGYAHALHLERRLRLLEREMAQLAQRAEEPSVARRLRRLAPRARTMRESLGELREALERLQAVLAARPA